MTREISNLYVDDDYHRKRRRVENDGFLQVQHSSGSGSGGVFIEELNADDVRDDDARSRYDIEVEEDHYVEPEIAVEEDRSDYGTIAEQVREDSPRSDRDATSRAPFSVTLTDPDVLDCSICCETLTVPVFQCDNGHIACSSCCGKMMHKCPLCSLSIGYNRCRAIEKVLESIKISCRNMKYGCKETVSYNKKNEHEKMCVHEPCSCPQTGCDFVGSSKQLYQHFDRKHQDSATHFHYDFVFDIRMNPDMRFAVLQEEVHRTLFILQYHELHYGDVANISCIAPSSSTEGFRYELVARNEESTIKLKSFTETVQRWSADLPLPKAYLMVPIYFYSGSLRWNDFQVCIRKNNNFLK